MTPNPDLFLVWLLACIIADLLPAPREPIMLLFGLMVLAIANALAGIPPT